jgi:4-amino-4-deoxy-L-arabinose transferase-like glycosyltransferase
VASPQTTLLPLVANDWMWRTGVAGACAGILLAGISLYLHARLFYGREDKRYRTLLPALAAAIFLLNPTALYLQTTPMSESVFIASIAVAAYLLHRWIARQSSGRLVAAACGMSVATLARYEAWPIAALSILVVLFASRGSVGIRLRQVCVFTILVATGPAYWLWHNWAIYGDALWFLTGPYSARSIYLQNQAALGWAKVFVENAPLALLLMSSMVVVCVGPLLIIPAAVGFVRVIRFRWGDLVNCAPALLLLVPFIFHTMSLYRGEIQVFPLSAFGLLNVRYGLPHLLTRGVLRSGCRTASGWTREEVGG